MVVEEIVGRQRVIGDGTTSEFTLDFKIQSTTNIPPEEVLSVYTWDGNEQKKLEFNTDYYIELNPDRVIFNIAPVADVLVTFLLEPDAIQQVEFQVGGKFPVKSVEGALDYIQRTNINQQDQLDRSPTLFETIKPDKVLLNPIEKPEFVIGINETEDGYELFDPVTLGAIIPDVPGFPQDPDYSGVVDRMMYLKEEPVPPNKKPLVGFAPLTYSETSGYISSLVDLYINTELNFRRSGFSQRFELIGGWDYKISFRPEEDIKEFDIFQVRRLGNELILENTEQEAVIINAKSNRVPFFINEEKTYQIGFTNLEYNPDTALTKSIGTFTVESDIEFKNPTTTHIMEFSSAEGDTNLTFSLSPVNGLVIQSNVGNTVVLESRERNVDLIPEHSGTANYLVKTLDEPGNKTGDSTIIDDGTLVTVNNSLTVIGDFRLNDGTVENKISVSEPGDIDFGITRPGLASIEQTTDGWLINAIDSPIGVGDVIYPLPTANYIPKVGNPLLKELVNSSFIDTGVTVTTTLPLTIATALTINNTSGDQHTIGFTPNFGSYNVLFDLDKNFPDGLVSIVSDGTNIFLNRINVPAGAGDVRYPFPAANFIPKVGNVGLKELQNSNLEDQGTKVVSTVPLSTKDTLIISNDTVEGSLAFSQNNGDYTVQFDLDPVRTEGFVRAISDGTTINIISVDTPDALVGVAYPNPSLYALPRVVDVSSFPKELGDSSLFDNGFSLRTTLPFTARTTVTIENTPGDVHSLGFTSDKGNYNIIYDIDSSVEEGNLVATPTGFNNILIQNKSQPVGSISWPGASLGAVPVAIDPNTLGNSFIRSSFTEEKVSIIANVEVGSLNAVEPLVKLNFNTLEQGIVISSATGNKEIKVRYNNDGVSFNKSWNLNPSNDPDIGLLGYTKAEEEGVPTYNIFGTTSGIGTINPNTAYEDEDLPVVIDSVSSFFEDNLGLGYVYFMKNAGLKIIAGAIDDAKGKVRTSIEISDYITPPVTSIIDIDINNSKETIIVDLEQNVTLRFIGEPAPMAVQYFNVLIKTKGDSVLFAITSSVGDVFWENGTPIQVKDFGLIPGISLFLIVKILSSGDILVHPNSELIPSTDIREPVFINDFVPGDVSRYRSIYKYIYESCGNPIEDLNPKQLDVLTYHVLGASTYVDGDEVARFTAQNSESYFVELYGDLQIDAGTAPDPAFVHYTTIYTVNRVANDSTLKFNGFYTSPEDDLEINLELDAIDEYIITWKLGGAFLSKVNLATTYVFLGDFILDAPILWASNKPNLFKVAPNIIGEIFVPKAEVGVLKHGSLTQIDSSTMLSPDNSYVLTMTSNTVITAPLYTGIALTETQLFVKVEGDNLTLAFVGFQVSSEDNLYIESVNPNLLEYNITYKNNSAFISRVL